MNKKESVVSTKRHREDDNAELKQMIECFQDTYLKHFGTSCHLLSQLHNKMEIIEKKVNNIEGQVNKITKIKNEKEDNGGDSDRSRSY